VRLFNALNGAEVKEIILADIRRAMEDDMQFQKHLTYPKVEWTWQLTVKASPTEPPQFRQQAEGEITVKQAEPEVTVLSGGRSVTKSAEQADAQAPDEARRDGGLPVPSPTKIGQTWAEVPVETSFADQLGHVQAQRAARRGGSKPMTLPAETAQPTERDVA